MIYGAAFSWNADILPEEEINRQISVFEFGDASGKLVSVLDLLCHQDAYPWRTAVMVQEALELHQDKEEAAELLRSCAKAMRMQQMLQSTRSAPFCTRKPAPSARRTVR